MLAVVLMLLGAAVAIRAVDHWARCETAMRLDRPLPPSRFPAILALTVAAGAILLIAGACCPATDDRAPPTVPPGATGRDARRGRAVHPASPERTRLAWRRTGLTQTLSRACC